MNNGGFSSGPAYVPDPDRMMIDSAIRQVEVKANDAKGTIEELLYLLDLQSKAPWPEMLDKMSKLAADMSQLQNMLRKSQMGGGKEEAIQHLRTHLFVPQRLSMDVDPELQELTQNRVHYFHHDLVPDYLRTKADTEHEREESLIEMERAGKDQNQIIKQTIGLNKHADVLAQSSLERAQIDSTAVDSAPTYSKDETIRLARAVNAGYGLERQRALPPSNLVIPPSQPPPQSGGGGGGVPPPAHMGQPTTMQQPHPMQQQLHPGMMHAGQPMPGYGGGPGPMGAGGPMGQPGHGPMGGGGGGGMGMMMGGGGQGGMPPQGMIRRNM